MPYRLSAEDKNMITLEHICKTYRVARRNSGLSAAFASLFHREYETIHALEDISFHIREGEIVGYIGPNGAGKSSTIKIMSGILVPDSGQCHINGMNPWKQRKEYVKDIGVVFGQRSQLWWDVPVADSFELLKDIYRLSDQSYHRNLSYLIQLLDIGTIIRTPVRQLSLGQRMRCELAASLLHSPRILFLDEPTIGLDAVSKVAVRNIIREINRDQGTTIILTTHDTQDIEALTNRILLIGKGRLLLDGDLQPNIFPLIIHRPPYVAGLPTYWTSLKTGYPLSRIYPAIWKSWPIQLPSACPRSFPSSIPGWKSMTCQSQAPPWMRWLFPSTRSIQYEKICFLFQNTFHTGTPVPDSCLCRHSDTIHVGSHGNIALFCLLPL